MSAAEPTVHLVDDEAAVRDALAFLFSSHGLAVQTYDGGRALLGRLGAGAQQPRYRSQKGRVIIHDIDGGLAGIHFIFGLLPTGRVT